MVEFVDNQIEHLDSLMNEPIELVNRDSLVISVMSDVLVSVLLMLMLMVHGNDYWELLMEMNNDWRKKENFSMPMKNDRIWLMREENWRVEHDDDWMIEDDLMLHQNDLLLLLLLKPKTNWIRKKEKFQRKSFLHLTVVCWVRWPAAPPPSSSSLESCNILIYLHNNQQENNLVKKRFDDDDKTII